MTISQILGIVATGLVIGGYVPQIVHLIKERCTAGISIPAFALWCLASFLFLIHAAMIEDAVFVGVQTVNLVAGGLIVGFCKKYEGEVCAFHRELYGGGSPSQQQASRVFTSHLSRRQIIPIPAVPPIRRGNRWLAHCLPLFTVDGRCGGNGN